MRALRPMLLLACLGACEDRPAPVAGASSLPMAGAESSGFVATAPSGCLIYWPHAVSSADRPHWSGNCDGNRVQGLGTVTWRRSDGEMRMTRTYSAGFSGTEATVEYQLPDGTRHVGSSNFGGGLSGMVRSVWPGGETRTQLWEYGQLVAVGPQPLRFQVREGRASMTFTLDEAAVRVAQERQARISGARPDAIAAAGTPPAVAVPSAPQGVAGPAAPAITVPATPAPPQAGVATPGLPAQPGGTGLPDPHRQPSPGGPDWVADARSNCRIHDAFVLGPHRVTWSGPCVNGRAEGNGVLVGEWVGEGEAHTDRYEGSMRAGKRHGRGATTVTAASRNTRTEATWRDGVLHGPALITASDGYRFQGNMAEGRAEGRGSWRGSDGATYEGDYAAGQRSGRGVRTWPDGIRCEGQFREDQLNGQGVCSFANGNRYEGGFVNGRQSGRGVETYAEGGRYDGEWREGQRSGRGVLVTANGARYDGEWRAGQRSGRGVLTFVNGDRYDGEFLDGNQHGRGSFQWANGNRYDGEFLDGNQHGRGSFQWANGNVYDGAWRAGRAHGQGSIRYFGEWTSGWFEEGCLRTTVGSTRIARWVAPAGESGAWCTDWVHR